jgi:hypothetical protein
VLVVAENKETENHKSDNHFIFKGGGGRGLLIKFEIKSQDFRIV